jgi:hypothetical protein
MFMVSPEEVVMAYRLILGREPESQMVVAEHCARHENLNALRGAFLDSEGFRSGRGQPFHVSAGDRQPLKVDVDLDPSALQRIFERVERCWRALGETEPYWSVASCDQFKSAGFTAHAREFYDSGKRGAERLLAWLSRNHVDLASLRTCCEYGCGVGRVTGWLYAHFPRVIAYDISESIFAWPSGIWPRMGGRMPAFAESRRLHIYPR